VVARAQEPPQRQVVHLLVVDTFRISDAAGSLQGMDLKPRTGF
jgi:hypothetical protein